MNDTEYTTADLKIRGRDCSFNFRCDALALDVIDGRSTLMLASVAGPHTSIKAFRAALSTGNTSFQSDIPGLYGASCRYVLGYRIWTHRLGLNTWHLLALAMRDGILPQVNDGALWGELHSERFTTPLVRDWLPWLREELYQRELLMELDCFQCDAALLRATTDDLDQILADRAPLVIPNTQLHKEH